MRDSDKLINPGEIDARRNYLRRSASTIRADFEINGYNGDAKNNASMGNLADTDIRSTQYARGQKYGQRTIFEIAMYIYAARKKDNIQSVLTKMLHAHRCRANVEKTGFRHI